MVNFGVSNSGWRVGSDSTKAGDASRKSPLLSMLSSIHDLLVQYLDMVEQIVREKRKC